MTDEDEFDLGAELSHAAEEAGKVAEGYREVATSLRAVADALRSLNGQRLYDAETHDRYVPKLLAGTMAVAHGKNMCVDIDKLIVDVYGRAGVWDSEVEEIAGRILKARSEVSDGAA